MRVRVAIVLSVVIAIGCTSTAPVATPTVVVPSSLAPRMPPRQVEDLIIGMIHRNEAMAGQVIRPPRIVSMTASATTQGIEWDVRAEGTFTTNRFPPGASPGAAATGYYVISDSDGGVLDYGLSLIHISE